MSTSPRAARAAAATLAALPAVLGLVLLVVGTLHLRVDPGTAGLSLFLAAISFATTGVALALARLGGPR